MPGLTGLLTKYRLAYVGRGNMEKTADQVCEKITRICRQLEAEHGVTFEEGRIVGLTTPVLMDWYDGMVARDLAMSTRNNYVVLLNPFLEWCVKRGILPGRSNPSDDTMIYNTLETHRLPREDALPPEQRKRKRFTTEEVQLLLQSISGANKERDRAILALFLASGIRETELCELTIGQVTDQPRGLIYLRRKGGVWKHTEVADFFYGYLDAYLKTRKDRHETTAPLFLSRDGNAMNRRSLYKLIANKERRLGLPTGVHILRHTVLSNIEKNYGVAAARDIANHRSISMTNRYDHTTLEERADAINRLDWSHLAP